MKNAQERAGAAGKMIESPIFLEAMSATREWAMESFRAAKTPDEAYAAKMVCEAASTFGAHLMAVMKLGEAEVKQIVRDREKVSLLGKKKSTKETMEQYLTDAAEARARYASGSS